MTKFFTNNFAVINLYKKQSIKSEIVTQIIYGESFSIFKKNKKWLRIKIKEDNYKGYIQNKIYSEYLEPSHKINKLNARVYKSPSKEIRIGELSFGSKIKVIDKKKQFYKFAKGWIDKKDTNIISFKEKNIFNKIKVFKNIKYKWGGKSFKGIDCAVVVAIFIFCSICCLDCV